VGRSLQRVRAAALPSGSAQTVLTVPSNHKYEVLQVQFFVGNPGAAETLAYYHEVAGGLRLFEWHKPPAFNRQDRMTWPALVLYDGDYLAVWVVSTGAALTYEVTVIYVDVDFT